MVTMAVLLAAMFSGAGEVTTTPEPAAVDGPGVSEEHPVLLVIQGRLRPGAEEIYQHYLAGTAPLMAEFGVEVAAVGHGIESRHTSDAWPVNGILRFRDQATAEAFLSDPRYLEIKETYRDEAYEELHLSFVQTRPPRVRSPRAVAEEAFVDFRAGLATGEWGPFLDRLSDDFTFHFPLGRFQGLNHGKERAAEFFAFVSEVYPDGLEIEEVLGVTAEGTRVVFEFKDRGVMFGKPYRNLVAISLDVRGEKICGYREYFGLVGPPPADSEDG